MKGYRGFDINGREIFYVPQNFILTHSGRSIRVDIDPSHLEELTLFFINTSINPNFVDSIKIPDRLLKEFRSSCFKGSFSYYSNAVEIFEYFEELNRLKKDVNPCTFFEYSVSKGYPVD